MIAFRNALLGAAGLVAMSLPAHAAGSATFTDTPRLKSTTEHTQLAQRSESPAFFKRAEKTKKKKKTQR
jgi:hypothetical protein